MAGPLADIEVIELAGIGPAQLGGMMLADLGARVTRVDRVDDVPGEPRRHASREVLARGRRSVALDLKREEGREVLRNLVDRADVLLDPFRPGVLQRLGIPPEETTKRNPRLIVAHMTGWGQDGPLAAAAGHDLNYIALAGALEPMGVPGEPPQVPLNLVADFGGGGMLLAVGVLAALIERERSGRGQILDVAMVDGVATLLASVLQLHAMGQWAPGRGSNWVAGAAPWYRAYRTSDDRYVTFASLEPKFYRLLLQRLDLDAEAWPQWDIELWSELAERIAQIVAARTLEEWCAELEGTDACFSPVLSFVDAAQHPHLLERGTYISHNGVLQPAPAPRFSRTPGAITGAPPWPGQDTRVVLLEVGAAADTLLAAGVARELPIGIDEP
ncbi:MAG: CoA transferase [Actinobacteria bacterium]|nr:CoA transferase [Actinomycetota bacterium]